MRNKAKVQVFEQADRIWKIAEMALEDFKLATADPRYIVDMDNWHVPMGQQCHICFAGSLLAGRYGYAAEVKPDTEMLTGRLFVTLNAFRSAIPVVWLDMAAGYFYSYAETTRRKVQKLKSDNLFPAACDWQALRDGLSLKSQILPPASYPDFIKAMEARIAFCKEHDL